MEFPVVNGVICFSDFKLKQST